MHASSFTRLGPSTPFARCELVVAMLRSCNKFMMKVKITSLEGWWGDDTYISKLHMASLRKQGIARKPDNSKVEPRPSILPSE